MSGISSGVGIFSGIDTRSLINQLLQIEARPKLLAQQRLSQLQTQQAAFLDINSTLLALKSSAAIFSNNKVFQGSVASSSDSNVLTATSSVNASEGSFSLTVSRLVASHQAISKGFVDKDTSGLGATQFTIEVGGGRIDSETKLSSLNGGAGVDRGKIDITDSAGVTATIDLSEAVTVNDVLDAINSNGLIGVTASVGASGYGLTITDTAGGAGQFSIVDVFGASTATSLGIAGSAAAGGSIVGADVLKITTATPLKEFNDGNGISFGVGGQSPPADFTITDRAGVLHNIVLGQKVDAQGVTTDTPVVTVQNLIDRISADTGGAVTAQVSADGARIVLTDTTGSTASNLIIADTNNRTTASELGIAASVASTTVNGTRVLAGINTRLSSSLNGGTGVTAGTFNITRRDGTNFNVSITADDTVTTIISAINAVGGSVQASVNKAGNGLLLTDSTATGSITSNLIVADTSGTAAADLKIATVAGGVAASTVDSGNLQTQYISKASLLSSLNLGAGIGIGSFQITDGDGATSTVDVDNTVTTLDDLITLINSKPTSITASINATGDGLLLTDTATGNSALTVADVTGFVAKKLKIAGAASDPVNNNTIDGSFETAVSLLATDTLQDITDKINNAGAGVDATIINAGDGLTPFRLSITSESTGSIGRFVLDTGGFDLGLDVLSKGEDAIAFFGSGGSSKGVLLTSSTNSLNNVINGVTINLIGTSSKPVDLVVQRDTASIEKAITDFIDSFNGVIDKLDFHDRFNVETNTRGALLGDSTVANIRRSLISGVQATAIGVTPQFKHLFETGVTIGQGGKLTFDSVKFRSAFEQDPKGVEELFAAFTVDPSTPTVLATDASGNPTITTPNTKTTHSQLGVIEQIELLTDSLTSSIDGSLTLRKNTLDSQIKLQEDRISAFDIQLESKRVTLERQFLGLERALGSLQAQQGALGSIRSLIG